MNYEEFKAAYYKYSKPVYLSVLKFVSQSDAEELTSNAFIKLWRSDKTFANENHIKNFVFAVARNEAINLIRKSKKKNTPLDLIDYSICAFPDNPGLPEIITKAINTLPNRQRQIIELILFEDMTDEQISKTLNKSEKNIRNLRSVAISSIKSFLK